MYSQPQVLDAIRNTREMLLPHWGNVPERMKEGPAHSVVTELDLAVERYLAGEIKKIDPTAEFAGEEYGGGRDAERFWLCDPIDGTAHFVRGLPFCSVMLACIEGGRGNFSAIYDFVKDDMYHASRGKGAFRNAEPIHVSGRPLENSYIALESQIDKPANNDLMRRMRKLSVLFSSITSGYEFSLVASGKLEARACVDPWAKDWDVAPGSLLVEEAGGIVTNIGLTSYDYRNVNLIASNPLVYRALTEGPEAIFPMRS